MAQCRQLLAQRLEVVDLSVEDDRQATVLIEHWLVAAGREVDHRQPPMGQRDPPIHGLPQSSIVRAAMRQAVARLREAYRIEGASVGDRAVDCAHLRR